MQIPYFFTHSLLNSRLGENDISGHPLPPGMSTSDNPGGSLQELTHAQARQVNGKNDDHFFSQK